MQDFYHPYYRFAEDRPADGVVASVVIRCSGSAADSEPTTSMLSYLMPTPPDGVRIGSSPDEVVFQRPVPDVTVRVLRSLRRIEIGGDHPVHVELQVRTLVRDQLLGQLEKLDGWVVFHAAAVHRDGVGIAFMGERNAGKTSSLIALMSTGNYDFLSADRVKLRPAEGSPQMRGMPARCNLHRIALETDPFLRPIADGRRYDAENKCLVDIADIARLAGVDHVGSTNLRLVVLPHLSEEHRGVEVEVVTDPDRGRSEVAAQLMEGMPVDKHTHWLNYFPDAGVSLQARLHAVLRQITSDVAVIRVRSNYHDYVEAIRAGSFDPFTYVDANH
jgi:hypothetical protein